MRVVVLADIELKEELLAQWANKPLAISWLPGIEELKTQVDADALIDLLFKPDSERIELLSKLLPMPVLINSVDTTLSELPQGFVRFNGWPTFLKRPKVEASCNNGSLKKRTEEIFSLLNKKVDWVADESGFITARVVAMVINEAYFAWGEGVSSKDEIDVAMKLGTNYPYGPFEWAEKIGVKKIIKLLNKLSSIHKRFEPAEHLLKEYKK